MKKTNSLTLEELSLFASQCAMLLKSGIVLLDGIDILKASYNNPRYEAILDSIAHSLEEGESIYTAFKKTNAFPEYMNEMVRIGEETGNLDSIMHDLSIYYRKEAELRTNIKEAILYPLTLLVMMAIVIGVLIMKVIPIFIQVYASLGLQINDGSNSMLQIGVDLGYIILVIVFVFMVLILIGFYLYKRHKGQKIAYFLAKFKPFSTIIASISAARFCQIFSMSSASGYPLEASLELMPHYMPTPTYQQKAEQIEKTMAQTNDFSQAISASKLFDPLSEKMIDIASSTGQLDGVMLELSDLYTKRADQEIEHIVSIIEPTFVAVLTLLVGGILLSIMLPLVSLMMSMR